MLLACFRMAIIYDMAVGLKKGHKVTPNSTRKQRPSRRKGVRCFAFFFLANYVTNRVLGELKLLCATRPTVKEYMRERTITV